MKTLETITKIKTAIGDLEKRKPGLCDMRSQLAIELKSDREESAKASMSADRASIATAIEIQAMTDQRAALRYYFADRKSGLLDQQISRLEKARAAREQTLARLKDLLAELRKKETSLNLERAGHGGDRLNEIERRLAEDTRTGEDRMRKAERFAELLGAAGMQPVETASQFSSRRREIDAAAAADSQHRADCQHRLTEAGVEAKVAQGRAAELNAELVSLRSRTSSIPKRSLDLRQLLCRELQLAEPLKKLGEFDIPVKLHREVTATIKVKVVAEGSGG